MEKEKFKTVEEFNVKVNALRKGGIFLSIVGIVIIYVISSFIAWNIDIREWHWGGRLFFVVLSLFNFFFWQFMISRKIAEIRINNTQLFLKELFDKRPQTKSNFQQRLEDLAKERNKPKE